MRETYIILAERGLLVCQETFEHRLLRVDWENHKSRNKGDFNLKSQLQISYLDMDFTKDRLARSPDASPSFPAAAFPWGLHNITDYASTEQSDGRVLWIDKMKLDLWVREAPHGSSF